MFLQCDMSECEHPDIPHGYLLIYDRQESVRPKFPLGVVFSHKQADALVDVCLKKNILPENLEPQVMYQISCTDLPEEHIEDEIRIRVFRQQLSVTRFVNLFTRQYFRHVAPGAIAIFYEKREEGAVN